MPSKFFPDSVCNLRAIISSFVVIAFIIIIIIIIVENVTNSYQTKHYSLDDTYVITVLILDVFAILNVASIE